MNNTIKKKKDETVINVYSAVGILLGMYYLYIAIANLFDMTQDNTKFEVFIICFGIVLPVLIIAACTYFLLSKENISKCVVLVFSIIILALGILQLFVNKSDIVANFYYLFDNRLKYTLYGLGILPIMYILLHKEK